MVAWRFLFPSSKLFKFCIASMNGMGELSAIVNTTIRPEIVMSLVNFACLYVFLKEYGMLTLQTSLSKGLKV